MELGIGIIGAGTVGGGVIHTLLNNAGIIRAKTGLDIRLVHVAEIDADRLEAFDRSGIKVTDDAEALIQDGSVIPEQNIATTWRRTLRIQHPYLYLPRMSSSLALSVASWLKNRKTRHIGIKCRGIPALWWGWKVQPAMIGDYSDSTLDLNARELRVMRIDNDYRFGEQSTWTSSLAVVETAFL